VYKTVRGKCNSIDYLKWRNGKKELLKIAYGCEPKNLYSADETGLFFRLPLTRC